MKKLYICEHYKTCDNRILCWACMPHVDGAGSIGICDTAGLPGVNFSMEFVPDTDYEKSLATAIVIDTFEDACQQEAYITSFKTFVLEEHYEKLKESDVPNFDVTPLKEWRQRLEDRLSVVEEFLGL